MSINRSMYIGLTGMKANSQSINVVGDNIANLNTVGFKAGRTVFQEMLGQSLMGASGRGGTMGGGVGVADVEKMFSQGALLGTGVSTDMAIAGEGFFAMEGEVGGTEGTFYTRAGQFGRDKEGFIVNASGLKLIGYPSDSSGVVSSTLGALQIDDAPMPPKATDKAEISVNLNAAEEDSAAGDFDLVDNPGAAEFQTSMTVYDSLGRSHEVTVFFDKAEGTNDWTYTVAADKKGIDGGEGFQQLATGSMTFDEDGKLNMADPKVDLKMTPNGLSEQTISLDFTGTTNIAAKSSQVDQTQNGLQAGTFQSLNIDANGEIVGTFSNGEQRVLGAVALARFKSNDGLQVLGAGLYAGSLDSGSVIMGKANSGGRGQLISGTLEQSTVDLATEFTNMIIAQRGYQANSRTITTADQMMQEAVSIKR